MNSEILINTNNNFPIRSSTIDENGKSRMISLVKVPKVSGYLLLDMSLLQDSAPASSNKLFTKNITYIVDPQIFMNLIVKSDKEFLSKNDLAILQISPCIGGCTYTFMDPNARDLDRCQRKFTTIEAIDGGEGKLKGVAAPTFKPDPGKKVMQLIRSFMDFAHIKHLLLDDGSMVLQCHDKCDGALTSLQMLETFKKGKSWYESQGGAVPEGTHSSFPLLTSTAIDKAYVDFVLRNDESMSNGQCFDYDRFRTEYLKSFRNSSLTNEVYIASSKFLKNLTVSTLSKDLIHLEKEYPELVKLRCLLENGSMQNGCHSQITTLGDLLTLGAQKGLREKDERHVFMHELRDRIVGNKDSEFFNYIIDDLRNPKKVSTSFCFLQLVLHQFMEFIRRTNSRIFGQEVLSKGKLLALLYKKDADALRSYVSKMILEQEGKEYQGDVSVDIQKRFFDAMLKDFDEDKSAASIKVVARSNKVNREKWIECQYGTGISDPFLAIESALSFLKKLSIRDFIALCPDLVKKLEDCSTLDKNSAVEDFLKDKSDDVLCEIFMDIFECAPKYLSSTAIDLFDDENNQSQYVLFSLAKYIVYSFDQFGIHSSK